MDYSTRPQHNYTPYPAEPPSYNNVYTVHDPYQANVSDSKRTPFGLHPDVMAREMPTRQREASTVSTGTSSSSSSSSHAEDLSDDQFLDEATAFTRHQHAAPKVSRPLQKPVVIPQMIAGMGQPFARAYAPSLLSSHGIDEVDFLEMLDNLNVVATASPPLQVVDLVGGLLGMVPHHWFQLAGVGVQALAKLGTAAVSKGRTELYLRRVNKEFFGPRRLKLSIVTRDAMMAKLQVPEHSQSLAPLNQTNISQGIVERRIEGLKPYMTPLTFDVPAPTAQSTMLAKLSAGQVNRQIRKSEKKAIKSREKQFSKSGKLDKQMQKLDREVSKAEAKAAKESSKHGGKDAKKAERELEKELKKIDKERRKKVGESDKEVKQAHKALWLCIENI